jgi:hypothetical protein
MLGKCRKMTSIACTDSGGICLILPAMESSNACNETLLTNYKFVNFIFILNNEFCTLTATLNFRSTAESPGITTSNSIRSCPIGNGSFVYMLFFPS